MDMGDVVFLTIQVLKPTAGTLGVEQMVFILTENVIWSIQEKKGDYFEWIRDRLANKIGLIREKNAAYLMYFILDSILENYSKTLEKIAERKLFNRNIDAIKPNPEFMHKIENRKAELFLIKKTTNSLRDGISKLEVTHPHPKTAMYFNELKDQASHLLSDLEFELNKLESAINLLFTIQGYRLNEVMKVLTMFSVVFIPLTFLAGIYGMNFEYMPELQYKNSYFFLLGIMAIVTIGTVIYFYRKRWL
jgi:magnesium transporter